MYNIINDGQYKGQDFFNFATTSYLPRHRWYHLKEGFSAILVEEAIKQKTDLSHHHQLNILEPFCGTGTTPLTAALQRHNSTAIEVNPFLAFTAKVKTAAGIWDKKEYEHILGKVISISSRGAHSPLEQFSTFTERENLTKWLFNKSILRRFTSLMNAIKKHAGFYGDALELAAIVAMYQCCNAKRDGKALRYKADWKELDYSSDDFIREFRLHALLILLDKNDHPIEEKYQPKIKIGDIRKVLSEVDEGTFDLVVTSPPYLNSFDYSDIYRPELFLGNYVRNNAELREIRLQTLRSHVQVDWSEEIAFESTLLNPIMQQLSQSEELWNKRIPLMVHAYFDDIYTIFSTLRSKMRLGGKVWLVVSTSAFGGIHIPVGLIIADAACQAGFNLNGIHCLRNLRAASQQWKPLGAKTNPLRESLIMLDA